jgi:hypothetical protein
MLEWLRSKFKAPRASVAEVSRPPTRLAPAPARSAPASPVVHQATVEEVLGLGKNPRFDAAVDDVDYEELQVVCRRGKEEIPLANPSRAFYFGDRPLYNQEAQRFNSTEKARILNTGEFPGNLKVFEELKRSVQRGFVIPFVGAGVSASAGLPVWRQYLLSKCDDAGLAQAAIEQRLDAGDYEGAMNDIVEKLTPAKFERDFQRDFAIPETIQGPANILPLLFDSCAVTTNFDRVLEEVYHRAGRPFQEKCPGCGNTKPFFRAIPSGERYLLKLHGNLDTADHRVLTLKEYNAGYGAEGDINMTFPLPKVLDRLFTSYSLLFLGCSLTVDRTMLSFMRFVSNRGADTLPMHYALLPSPPDADGRRAMDQRLAQANITALWYPNGEHQSVGEILELLAAQ